MASQVNKRKADSSEVGETPSKRERAAPPNTSQLRGSGDPLTGTDDEVSTRASRQGSSTSSASKTKEKKRKRRKSEAPLTARQSQVDPEEEDEELPPPKSSTLSSPEDDNDEVMELEVAEEPKPITTDEFGWEVPYKEDRPKIREAKVWFNLRVDIERYWDRNTDPFMGLSTESTNSLKQTIVEYGERAIWAFVGNLQIPKSKFLSVSQNMIKNRIQHIKSEWVKQKRLITDDDVRLYQAARGIWLLVVRHAFPLKVETILKHGEGAFHFKEKCTVFFAPIVKTINCERRIWVELPMGEPSKEVQDDIIKTIRDRKEVKSAELDRIAKTEIRGRKLAPYMVIKLSLAKTKEGGQYDINDDFVKKQVVVKYQSIGHLVRHTLSRDPFCGTCRWSGHGNDECPWTPQRLAARPELAEESKSILHDYKSPLYVKSSLPETESEDEVEIEEEL